MIGFKEFLEYEKKKVPTRNFKGGGFEMQTFLERDFQRIDRLTCLLESKASLLNRLDQADVLKSALNEEIIKAQDQLIQNFLAKDSIFKKNLDEILQAHFNF